MEQHCEVKINKTFRFCTKRHLITCDSFLLLVTKCCQNTDIKGNVIGNNFHYGNFYLLLQKYAACLVQFLPYAHIHKSVWRFYQITSQVHQ